MALANQFHLSRRGQERMEEALTRLTAVSVLQDLLWLGFGYRSLIRTMANTVGGIKCIALCSCLAEVHSEQSAARILAELWKESGYPDEYEPSHAQFLNLVTVCAGVLIKTPFAQTMDVMLGDTLWKNSVVPQFRIPRASDFKDIAKALRGLFELSRGEADSILLVGGSDCSFIVALAYWVFDLTVYVEDDEDELIFTNASDPASANVCVQYGSARTTAIQISKTTYILGAYTKMFDREPEPEDEVFVVRTPWDGCLHRTFGSAFEQLTLLPRHLGSYLGSLARLYKALVLGELNIGSMSRTFYYDFGEASFGQGFIQSVLSTFSELARIGSLQQIMENAAEKSFDEALKTVKQSIHALKVSCNCDSCLNNRVSGLDPRTTCLVGIACAIREIARTVACVVLDHEDERPILPSVLGIRSFYKRHHFSLWMRHYLENGTENTLSSADNGDFSQHILGLCERGYEASYHFHPLYNVSLLYQGPEIPWGPEIRHFSSGRQNPTALSRRGICCYLDTLRAVTCQPELARLVHVLPGHINYRNHVYSRVQDVPDWFRPEDPKLSQAIISPASKIIPEDIGTLSAKTSFIVEPLATQASTGNSLYCSYRVSAKSNRSITIKLHPGQLMMQVLRCFGRIACSNSEHCSSELASPCSIVQSGWKVSHESSQNLMYDSEIACCIWPASDDLAKCIVLELHLPSELAVMEWEKVYLRRKECLSCCTVAVWNENIQLREVEQPELKGVAHVI